MTNSDDIGVGIVAIAKEENSGAGLSPIMLKSGVWAIVRPVSASLIEEALMLIEEPEVPTFYNEDKDREEPNPNDPKYLAALENVQRQSNLAAIDAAIMFAVDLVDADGNPIDPPNDGWVNKLRFMERQGIVDLQKYDLDDEVDREFLYKKYIAVTAPDLDTIMRASGVGEEEIRKAADSFRRK